MTASTLLLSLLIVALVLFVLRIFWVEIAIIGLILYIVWNLTWTSFFSAILWAVFVTGSAKGWGWTWLFFFLTYGGIVLVAGLIAKDAFNIISDSLGRFFRRILK